MFEGSLVESRGLVVSETQRWTALGSLTLQCVVAGLLVAIPMLRPEPLPVLANAPRVALPVPLKPVVVPVQPKSATSSSTAMSTPAAAPAAAATQQFIFPRTGDATDGPAPAMVTNLRMGLGGSEALGVLRVPGVGSGPGISVVRARPSEPTRLSSGVTAGMLLAPIQPIYPPIARVARVQGAVVLEVVISKTGRIESLRAVSGPEMLRAAALTAVQRARYRPYLLSGEPTDVQTTITVVFRLGS
jgi:periplasmic protein TonB